MAKVEQFPDQSGENGITENIKDQKTHRQAEERRKIIILPTKIRLKSTGSGSGYTVSSAR